MLLSQEVSDYIFIFKSLPPVLFVILLFKFICFCRVLTSDNPLSVKCNLLDTKLCTINHFFKEIAFLVRNGNTLKYAITLFNTLNPVTV